jgi:hypothetical protein
MEPAKHDKSKRQAQNIVNCTITARFAGMQWQAVKQTKDYAAFAVK